MKQEKSTNQIKLGMILSYINIGIGNLIPLFYTPIMLSLLGQNEYGLYKIASSTTSYLSLIAFGIGSAVSRYLIKARTEAGKEAEENMFGLFYLIFQIIAILVMSVGMVLVLNLNLIYGKSLSLDELTKMKILVSILVVNMAINFSASSYNAVVSTHEKFIFIQAINILSTIGIPVLNLIVLFSGYKSIGMAASSLAINVLIRCAYVYYARKVINIKPRFKALPVGCLKEIFIFSFWIFVANISSQLFSATDTLIIGMIPELATVGAAVYSIGNTFPNIMFSLAQVVPGLFMPTVNKMVFKGSTGENLTDLMIKVGRMQGMIVTLVCSGFIAFGKPFIEVYAGMGYEEAYWVAVIIMIPNCIALVQSVGHSILQAKNMHKFRSKMYLMIAILNAILTWFMVRRFGVVGAAIPTGFTYIIGNGVILNWYYWKKVCLNIPRFWKSVIPIFFVGSIMCLLVGLVARWIDFYKIYNMVAGIILYSLIYGIILWFKVLTNVEKETIFTLLGHIVKNNY